IVMASKRNARVGLGEKVEYFDGGKLIMGATKLNLPPHERHVSPFYLDPTEVTVREFRKIWRQELPDEVKDKLNSKEMTDEHAMAFVTFHEAVAHAEAVGKRLP